MLEFTVSTMKFSMTLTSVTKSLNICDNVRKLGCESTSCQAANYCLAQKAEDIRTKCTSAQCNLGWIPSPLLSLPLISDVSHCSLKGTPQESAFTLPRLSHRPSGKMTWTPQH